MDMRRYLDLFIAESRDHLGGAYEVLNRLETDSRNKDLWRELLRHAHSLKGMAATMGYESMVALAHAAEDLAEEIAEADPAGRASLPLLGDALACLGRIVDRVERGEDPHSARAVRLADALRGGAATERAGPPAAAPSEPPPAPAEAPRRWCVTLDVDDEATRCARTTVRLLAQVGTVASVVGGAPPTVDIATGRFAGRVLLTLDSTEPREEIGRKLESIDGVRAWSLEPENAVEERPEPPGAAQWLRVRADRVDAAIERVLELRREHERGTRAPAGAADSVDASTALLDEIYGELMDMRLVPFGSVAHRIHQGVRELASAMGKSVRFSIEGESVRLDRRVLDALVDPLLHAVRNGLDHGIEPPDERRAKGKEVEGKLCLRLDRRGDRVRILVEDDGRGLNPDELRRAAVRTGQIDVEAAAALPDADALMLAALPDVSTAAQISHVSGRGVGLDVVHEAVKQLGGFLEIRSSQGAGTSVCLSVPFSVALFAALLVRSRGELFAVPMAAIDRAIDTRAPGIPLVQDAPPPLRLSERLGLAASGKAADADRWLIAIRAGDRRGGLRVDEIVGHKELVVEPLRGPISRLRHYAGAALLEDGTIALVLDTTRLLGAPGA